MKDQADKHQTNLEFQVGDYAYLKLESHGQISTAMHHHQKLRKHYFISLMFGKNRSSSSQNRLPQTHKIHLDFHVSLLKPDKGDPPSSSRPLRAY